jgi:hypothetical protein
MPSRSSSPAAERRSPRVSASRLHHRAARVSCGGGGGGTGAAPRRSPRPSASAAAAAAAAAEASDEALHAVVEERFQRHLLTQLLIYDLVRPRRAARAPARARAPSRLGRRGHRTTSPRMAWRPPAPPRVTRAARTPALR